MTGITLIPSNGFDQITEISCGTSSPKLSGTIDLSFFSNLTDFINNNNDITSISGYENNSNLLNMNFARNKITGNIPNHSSNSSLVGFFCFFNLLTGSIPSLSANTQLQNYYCDRNQLTGNIPNFSNNGNLRDFRCYSNQLTGSIPSLSANALLQTFYCYTNSLTDFSGGSVSNTLGDFQAQNNQLTSTTVNDILAAFVAANRITGTRVLNLGGTGNAAPTGQGLIDKQTLIDRGWTVTTN
jgi:hypothetical protein